MLGWFLRQTWPNKLAVGLATLTITPVLWTAGASYLFIDLMGQGLRQYYPRDDLGSYLVWWDYFPPSGQPHRVQLWLLVSGLASALPFAAFAIRQVIDHFNRGTRPSLYGKVDWANRDSMKKHGVTTSKNLFR